MKKILVTGAAGFIGSNLCEYLLDHNYKVIGLDNFTEKFDARYTPKIKHYHIKDFKDHKNFTLYSIDLLDIPALKNLFDKENDITDVIHMAGWADVTQSFVESDVYVKNNVEATMTLVLEMLSHKIHNLIFASTSSVYGEINDIPFFETMNTDHPLAPYGASKKACEVFLSTYSKYYDLNVSIFRIFNPIGKRLRTNLAIPRLVNSCEIGSKFYQFQDLNKSGRDYTHINHIFEACEFLFENPVRYEIFNMGNGDYTTLGDLIDIVQDISGKSANVVKGEERKGEQKFTFANVDKAKKMLNFNPKTSVKDAIKEYYDWFMQQEDWYKKGDY